MWNYEIEISLKYEYCNNEMSKEVTIDIGCSALYSLKNTFYDVLWPSYLHRRNIFVVLK